MSETRMLYLIAELSRKIEDIEYATRYFSKVIEKQSTSLEPKIIEMAKERWQEIRDEKRKRSLKLTASFLYMTIKILVLLQ